MTSTPPTNTSPSEERGEVRPSGDGYQSKQDAKVVKSHSRTWTPAQIVAVGVGLIFVVVSGVALLRTGVGDMTATTTVGPLTQTAGFALGQLGLGLILLLAASNPRSVRGTSTGIGVVMAAFGLIAMIEPGGMSTWVGEAAVTGVVYTVIGVVVAATGWLSPLFSSQQNEVITSAERRSGV